MFRADGLQGNRIVWSAKNKVEIERFMLRDPRDAEVLTRTLYSGISPGTERAYLTGLPNTPTEFPQYPGYCNVGEVVAKGSGVTGVPLGLPVISCSPHTSHVLVPESKIQSIPEGISLEEAVFVNLASISLQAVRKSGVELGEAVVVLGQGVVGILALQLAKLSGGLPVIGIDPYDYRLNISEELGADHTLNPGCDEVIGRVRSITRGGAKVVIDATGDPKAILLALKLASDYGRVVLLGCTRGESSVNFYSDVHKRGLCIIGAHNCLRPEYDSFYRWWTVPDDNEVIFRLLAKGSLKVKQLVTSKVPIKEAPRAYKRIVHSKESTLTILLDWTENRWETAD